MKNSFINPFLLFIFLSAYIGSANAQQNFYPVLSMELRSTAVSDTIVNGFQEYSDSTVFNVHMLISLYDTAGITSLHVGLGRTNGATNLLNKTFTYDVFGNLGDGTFYSRSEYTVDLNLGNYRDVLDFYSQVVIEKTGGSLTDAIVYSR